MSSVAKNRKYLQALIAPIVTVPAEVAAEVAVRIFAGMVDLTNVDSGQAALNWHLQPYIGSAQFHEQQILWGYAGRAPISPAGYKWSGGGNEMQIKSELVMQQMTMLSDMKSFDFDGISVHNPIEPGFAGFGPGDDSKYFEYALSSAQAQMGEIISKSLAQGLQIVQSRHAFLRAG